MKTPGPDEFFFPPFSVSSLKLEELLLNTKFLSNGALTALANGLISGMLGAFALLVQQYKY
jgi:hypothetical protein